MTLLNLVIMLALVATVVALGTGIVSMVRGGEFDRRHDVQLMVSRVGLQGVTFALLLLALFLANA